MTLEQVWQMFEQEVLRNSDGLYGKEAMKIAFFTGAAGVLNVFKRFQEAEIDEIDLVKEINKRHEEVQKFKELLA